MKKLVTAILLLTSVNAVAQTTATVTAASNYIWRGLSFSALGLENAKGQGVVQGSIDYAHSSGLGLGLFVGAADTISDMATGAMERDNEFDPTISYTYAINEDTKVIAAATQYTYVKNSNNNSMDYQLSLIWKQFRLDGSYMPNYFGTKATDTYARLSARQPLDEKLGLVLAVGNSSLTEEQKAGFKSYVDYRAGLYFVSGIATIELAFSDTNRKSFTDVDFKDEAATLAVSATFQ